jgi:hypothetical protein
MSSPHHDSLMRALASLPPVLPDEAHADHLRARCRARLVQPPRQMPVVEPATVGTVSGIYLWQIVRTLLAL